MASFLKFLQNLGLLLARLGLGGILLLHGWMRWNAGVQKQIDYLTQFRTLYARSRPGAPSSSNSWAASC